MSYNDLIFRKLAATVTHLGLLNPIISERRLFKYKSLNHYWAVIVRAITFHWVNSQDVIGYCKIRDQGTENTASNVDSDFDGSNKRIQATDVEDICPYNAHIFAINQRSKTKDQLPTWTLAGMRVMAVSLSALDCAWKNPSACPNSCAAVPNWNEGLFGWRIWNFFFLFFFGPGINHFECKAGGGQ